MSVVGQKPNWTVTGKLDVTYPGQKKKTEEFCNSFVAKNKADAIKQAQKLFDEMKNDIPGVTYANLRALKAEPSGW